MNTIERNIKGRISLAEQKQIQLEMLCEIDSICKENGIRYSLAYGTLLGAIRHKGYIPWDDDIDINMPLPDIERFKSVICSQKLGFCDIGTVPHYEYAFPRVCFLPTYNKINPLYKSYGINIDVYPIVGLPTDMSAAQDFLKECEDLCQVRYEYIKWRSRVIRHSIFHTIPGFDSAVRHYSDKIKSCPYENSSKFVCVGRPDISSIFHCDMFASTTDVEFEGHFFKAFSDWDSYLKNRYGNYMQLPPENLRVPRHGGIYYWK